MKMLEVDNLFSFNGKYFISCSAGEDNDQFITGGLKGHIAGRVFWRSSVYVVFELRLICWYIIVQINRYLQGQPWHLAGEGVLCFSEAPGRESNREHGSIHIMEQWLLLFYIRTSSSPSSSFGPTRNSQRMLVFSSLYG